MSWEDYVNTTLMGTDDKDAYIAGIFGDDGRPWAVHPSSFTPSESDVIRLIDIIAPKENNTICTNGCTLDHKKYVVVRQEDKMFSFQRKKNNTGDDDLKPEEKWPLCAYKINKGIMIRISKRGPDAGRDNTRITGQIGDYLTGQGQ